MVDTTDAVHGAGKLPFQRRGVQAKRDVPELYSPGEGAYEMLKGAVDVGGRGRGRAWSSVESMRRAKRESVHTNSKTRRCVEELKSSGLRRRRAVPNHNVGRNALCQGGRWVMARNAAERRKVHRRSAERQFGFAEVDIEVPRELLEKFEEMPPLFYTKPVPSEAVPQHIKDYLAHSKLKPMHDQRRLVGALSAPKILMYSPLLK